jgi:hypothetical protein
MRCGRPWRSRCGQGPYEYRVYTSCSSGAARGATGTRQTVSIDRPCDGDRVDVHVEAIFERQLQASLTVTGQPIVDGGLLALDASWVDPVALGILFTDRPVESLMYPDVFAYYRGRRVTASVHPGYCLERTPTCVFRPWAAGAADRVGIEARITSPDGSGDVQQLRTMISLAGGTEHTVPIRLLPWISEGQFDAATRRATWRAGIGDRADATTLLVGNDDVAWLVIAPPEVQELQLPDLSGLAGVSPPDLTGAGGAVLLFDRDDTDGYDQFRARGEALSFATFNDDVGARSSGGGVVALP